LTFIFQEIRRRDRDNLLASFKPGVDAIVDAGLVLDDDSEHLQIGIVEPIVNRDRAPLVIIDIENILKE
jgi:Holliday junction resolvase RusA-like endonuclease